MIAPLLRRDVSENAVTLAYAVGALMGCVALVLSGFTAGHAAAYEALIGAGGQELSVGERVAAFLRSFAAQAIPLAACALVNYRLIGRHIASGSVVYLLLASHTRKNVALTQAAFSVSCITGLYVFLFLVLYAGGGIASHGALGAGRLAVLCAAGWLVQLLAGSLVFLCGVALEDGQTMRVLSAVIPAALAVLFALTEAGVGWACRIDALALLRPEVGIGAVALAVSLLACAAAAYGAAVYVFVRRDLRA